MRHLKRFNERLKSSTYASAASKLKNMGHVKRSDKLINWTEEVKNKEKEAKELENLKYFKHDVPFKIILVKNKWNSATKSNNYEIMMSGNFYLKPYFDDSWACDQYLNNVNDDGTIQYAYNMPFEIGIMAADKETKEKFKLIESKLDNEIYEGVYWPQRLYYRIINEGYKKITPTGEFYWECSENDEIIFENRSEALRFKRMFVDAVHGKNTFGDTKWHPSMYEQLKKFFLGEWLDRPYREEIFNEEAFKRFLDSTNKMSINQLYKN